MSPPPRRRLKWLLPLLAMAVVVAAWGLMRYAPSSENHTRGGTRHAIFDDDSDLPARLVPGRDWVIEYDCGRCHAPDIDREGPGIPPDLSFAGSRYRREWVVEYILKPYRRRYISDSTRPDVKMANFRLKRDRAEAIADYLLYHKDTARFASVPMPAKPDSAAIAQGRWLFQRYQCGSCHRIAGEGGRVGPALDGAGARLTGGYIRALLADPIRVIPGISMKDNDLWPEEIDALAVYLHSLRPNAAR